MTDFFNSLSTEHKRQVVRWLSQNLTPTKLKSELKKLGVNASLKQIRELMEVGRKNKNEDSGLYEVEVIHQTRPVVVGIDSLFERFNIPNNLNDLDDVLENIQKMAQQVFLLESAIRLSALEDHVAGLRRYPTENVKGYEASFRVLSTAMSLKDHVSLRAAIKTIESEGLRIIEENQG